MSRYRFATELTSLKIIPEIGFITFFLFITYFNNIMNEINTIKENFLWTNQWFYGKAALFSGSIYKINVTSTELNFIHAHWTLWTNYSGCCYTGVLDDLGGKKHAANVVLHLMSEKLNNGQSYYTWINYIILLLLLCLLL